MFRTDKRGVAVSTSDALALARLETAIDRLLAYDADAMAAIDATLEADPNCVMGHCVRAGLLALSMEKAALAPMRRSVEAAERLLPRANDRERGHIAALRAWLDGDLDRAVRHWGKVIADNPRDLCAILFAHRADFLLGDTDMLRRRIADVLPRWEPCVPGYDYLLGMRAFGLVETGQYARAEEIGRRAVASGARNPWAIHAVAQAFEMESRLAEGVAWLTNRSGDWAPNNMFARQHWWHLALYHLELLDHQRMLALYDQQMRRSGAPGHFAMIDATSLLWRLFLRGVNVGARWAALAEYWAPLAEDGHYGFNDLHAMMAFSATGRRRTAATLMRTLTRKAEQTDANARMTRLALPAIKAVRAFGEGNYAAAVHWLTPLRGGGSGFGGSNAQRNVLTLTLMEAALRDGQTALGERLAEERVRERPESPFAWRCRARALALSGANDAAALARDRAEDYAARLAA